MNIHENYDENISMDQISDIPIDIMEPNKILKGEIVTIDDDFAYVNVGIKTDGRINLSEFKSKPNIGDDVEVMLVNKRLVDGMYVFSKTAADSERKWSSFISTYGTGIQKIQGKLQSSNEKGFIVDCTEVDGFLPFSLAADLRSKKNPDSANSHWFKVVSVDEKRHTVLLSRKDLVEEENNKKWDNFLSKYKAGDKVQGKVNKFVEFGAFVEIEGIDALLHKNEMSWKKVFKPKKLLNVGEVSEFIILGIDKKEGKISLGLKQLTGDPWLEIEKKYHTGDVVTGEVVTLTNFGVFIEIEEGVDGFIDSSEMSWTKKNVNPKDLFTKGQKIQAKILDIKKEDKKIPLGYKQLFPNPWDTISERFKIGTIHKNKIKKIINFGMFVELEDGIDGLIHTSDITWDDNAKDPMSRFKAGDVVEFKILDIKKDEMKISCGIKQLEKSPWSIINEKYPSGTKLIGKISGIVAFGLFVKLEDNVEGLVHISEVSTKRVENLEERYKIGDEVNIEVLGIDIERRRLSLSMKRYEATVEKEELNKLLNESGSKKVTIGDFLKGNNKNSFFTDK